MAEDASKYISPDQLRVGLYIHLDRGWMEHPFTFNSFKIKSQDQIDAIRALGLEQIRYEPHRSDAEPIAMPASGSVVYQSSEPSEAQLAAIAAKKMRIERLAKQRQAIAECEKKLLGSARICKSITRNLFAKPQESIADADKLVSLMAESILTDKDVAVHLMSDKIGGEDVYLHVLNVAVLAMILGKELGLPRDMIRFLGMGAIFHDIGKADVPERVLYKDGPLTKPEREVLQQHVSYGLNIGKKAGLPPEVLAAIYQHHEYADGTGYPRGIKGDAITPLTKIVTVVNEYDNLCNRMNPAESVTPYEALALMFGKQRSRFEAAPLNVFIRCLGVYPPGTIVQLTNDVIGTVVAVNSSKPLRPSVLVYDPDVPKNEAVILDLEEETEFNISKCLRPSQVPQPVLEYLNFRKRMTYYAGPAQND